jgi:hypothetical protein
MITKTSGRTQCAGGLLVVRSDKLSANDVCHGDEFSLAVGLLQPGQGGWGEHGVERSGVHHLDAVLIDVEMGEQRLVQQPAVGRCGSQVVGVAVKSQGKHATEVGFNLIEGSGGGAQTWLRM